jgi:hypothetical protein
MLSNCTAVVVVALVVAASALAGEGPVAIASSSESGPGITGHDGFSAIAGSFEPTTDVDTGEFSSPKMTIEVVLTPRHESQLSDLLANLYNSKSKSYQQWLTKGKFHSLSGISVALLELSSGCIVS